MLRITLIGAVFTLGTLVTGWARAEALVLDDGTCAEIEQIAWVNGTSEGWESELAACGYIPSPVELLADDDRAFMAAQADVAAAPSFCAVTYIRRDETRGYVAVCELVSEGGAL